MIGTRLLLFLVFVILLCSAQCREDSILIGRFAFAGGNEEYEDQSFWSRTVTPTLKAEVSQPETSKLDLFLWLGGAVQSLISKDGVDYEFPKPPSFFSDKFSALRQNKYYNEFLAQNGVSSVRGAWDDADFGTRTSGRNDGLISQVKPLYLKFLTGNAKNQEPFLKDVESRAGLYFFHTVALPTSSPHSAFFVNSMCFVVLDVWSDRSEHPNFLESLLKPYNAYFGMKAAPQDDDILGETQWKWLEGITSRYLSPMSTDEKGRSQCMVSFIVSPLSFFLNDYKPFDGWDLFPRSRSRLLRMLRAASAERFVFLSSHNGGAAEFGIISNIKNRRGGKQLSKFAHLYEHSSPLRPVTQAAAELLPPPPSKYSEQDEDDKNALCEISSHGLTHSIRQVPFLGTLFPYLVRPNTPEDSSGPQLHGFAQYVCLERQSDVSRNFGSIRLVADGARVIKTVDDSLAATRVLVNLYSVKNGQKLISKELPLTSLPRYETRSVGEPDKENGDNLPQFYLHNSPSAFPYLKKWTLDHQQPEINLFAGSLHILLQVARSFIIVAVVLAVFIVVVFIALQLMEAKQRQEKKKMD